MSAVELDRLPTRPPDDLRHRPTTRVWVHWPTTRVWVHWHGSWRPGVVVASVGPAVTVLYRYSDDGGTVVDTFLWEDLAAQERTEPDTFVG